MSKQTLIIHSSARTEGSVTRDLTQRLADQLGGAQHVRDLNDALPHVDGAWVAANFTDPAERSDAQNAKLAQSDALVAEVMDADTLVIGVPIYNFGVPAALKSWIDLIARARVTFAYTSDGPKGLLTGKTAYLVVASGGVAADSAVDFAVPYMRHVLGFVGITDVRVIDASGAAARGETARSDAAAQIAAIGGELAA